MANIKISELPNYSGSIDGSEIVPIVQEGETRKVQISDMFSDMSLLSNLGDVSLNDIGDGYILQYSAGDDMWYAIEPDSGSSSIDHTFISSFEWDQLASSNVLDATIEEWMETSLTLSSTESLLTVYFNLYIEVDALGSTSVMLKILNPPGPFYGIMRVVGHGTAEADAESRESIAFTVSSYSGPEELTIQLRFENTIGPSTNFNLNGSMRILINNDYQPA